MLLNRLNSKIVNLLYVTGTRDKSSQLNERDSSPVIIVSDRRRKGIIMCGVRTERDLGQRR